MFKQLVSEVLAEATQLEAETIMSSLEIPPDSTLGDYAFPCFLLAQKEKKAPPVIAEELAQKIVPEGAIKNVTSVGPYVNFFINESAWVQSVVAAAKGSLWEPTGSGANFLIEYPSPNTNKPLHLGHVRNMVLGSTIILFLEANGERALSVNLNNDRGIHICKSMLAYKKWGNNKNPDKKSDHFVGDFYVQFEQAAKENEALREEAQEMLRAWEAGDEDVRAVWEKMNAWAHEGFAQTYKRYGVSFDKEYYESDIYTQGKKIIEENRDLFEEEDGALVANLEKYTLPNKVVLRADGTSIYITQDIALTLQKIKDFSPDKQVWVVANEQNLHFQQLFAILDMLGTPKDTFHHLSYGMISLPDGKMKSREGRVIDADDILNEMESLAAKNIRERHADWSNEQVSQVAQWLAMGAIRFFIIKYDPAKDFIFDAENSLSFEGDTGPYVQYTHARIRSILRKAGGVPNADLSSIGSEEREVCLAVAGMRDAFLRGAEQFMPHLLAQQLLKLTRAVNTYYHAHPVLKAEPTVRDARLVFLDAVSHVIAQGLELLSIHAPEEM